MRISSLSRLSERDCVGGREAQAGQAEMGAHRDKAGGEGKLFNYINLVGPQVRPSDHSPSP